MKTQAADTRGARLELRGIALRYGAVEVLRGLDLALEPGQRHWLAGANGAGKSSLLGLIAGARRPDAGEIALDGRPVTHLGARARADLGIARSWQLPLVFEGQRVREQLAAAIAVRGGARYGLGAAADFARPAAELAERFGLAHGLDARPAELAYAERRLLDLALAFAAPARLLLLDEPSAGLSRQDAAVLFARLRDWTEGTTVLIVEHDHRLAAGFADRALRLEEGQVRDA